MNHTQLQDLINTSSPYQFRGTAAQCYGLAIGCEDFHHGTAYYLGDVQEFPAITEGPYTHPRELHVEMIPDGPYCFQCARTVFYDDTDPRAVIMGSDSDSYDPDYEPRPGQARRCADCGEYVANPLPGEDANP